MVGEPAQTGVAVLDRHRIGMFGCQAVVDGEHRYAAVGDVAGHWPVIDGDAAADHPASMQVQRRWPEGRAVLDVPAQQDVATIDLQSCHLRIAND